eukprot:CAMPEP_0175275798 /NCGR_PEP_ID=MMETSP0093-20121207/48155_1 /TAXON_ID=311494 /ORGANISM="Alexandrium monilatum, Strain CCMP3105" /LENGTH=37 /DNA_ID= /DNA_START= /DNA_END= /DNA_ORIENTATION=
MTTLTADWNAFLESWDAAPSGIPACSGMEASGATREL